MKGAISIHSYDVTVPKINGSAFTGDLEKEVTAQSATVDSVNVGGDYKFQVRLYDWNNQLSLSDWGTVDDYTKIHLPNNASQGTECCMEFKTTIFTFVDVNGYGDFSPDYY